MIALSERFGWDYYQILNQPDFYLEALVKHVNKNPPLVIQYLQELFKKLFPKR